MSPNIETPILTESIVLCRNDYFRLTDALDGKSGQMPAKVLDYLLDTLDRARVLDPDLIPDCIVRLGSTVTVLDREAASERQITLVWPGEEQYPQRISVLTALGAALLGTTEGDAVTYNTPDGRLRHLSVLAVKKPNTT
ncbi:MAG TPA: GreA/GreB family elongation factor [Azospirillum sp.]|nr:GreA/GreB family elongation factor [Azospirillum sp.]